MGAGNELYRHYKPEVREDVARVVGILFDAIVPDEVVRELVEPWEVRKISRPEGEREDYRAHKDASFLTMCTYADEVRLRELIEETAAELREYWEPIHSLYRHHVWQGRCDQMHLVFPDWDYAAHNPYTAIERSNAAGEAYLRGVRASNKKK